MMDNEAEHAHINTYVVIIEVLNRENAQSVIVDIFLLLRLVKEGSGFAICLLYSKRNIGP